MQKCFACGKLKLSVDSSNYPPFANENKINCNNPTPTLPLSGEGAGPMFSGLILSTLAPPSDKEGGWEALWIPVFAG